MVVWDGNECVAGILYFVGLGIILYIVGNFVASL